jgi:hypothetical protein
MIGEIGDSFQMPKQHKSLVAGVDGCKGGWFITVVSARAKASCVEVSSVLRLKNCFVARTFADVLLQTGYCVFFVSIFLSA